MLRIQPRCLSPALAYTIELDHLYSPRPCDIGHQVSTVKIPTFPYKLMDVRFELDRSEHCHSKSGGTPRPISPQIGTTCFDAKLYRRSFSKSKRQFKPSANPFGALAHTGNPKMPS